MLWKRPIRNLNRLFTPHGDAKSGFLADRYLLYHVIKSPVIAPFDCVNNIELKVDRRWKYLTGVCFTVAPYNVSTEFELVGLTGTVVGFCTLHINGKSINPVQIPIQDWFPISIDAFPAFGVGYTRKPGYYELKEELTYGSKIQVEIRNQNAFSSSGPAFSPVGQNLQVNVYLRGIGIYQDK